LSDKVISAVASPFTTHCASMQMADTDVEAPPSAYDYDKLPDATKYVRLFELHPGDGFKNIVRGRLVTVKRSKVKKKYQALSYAWGSDIKTKAVMLDGKILGITANLEEALRRLQAEETRRARVLWIDAICINQEDPRERSEQVAKMASTFSNAHTVIAWLGEDSANCDGRIMFHCFEELSTAGREYDAARRALLTQCHAFFEQFFNRPLWRRTWIYQEVFVAKRAQLMCGHYVLPWETLMAGLDKACVPLGFFLWNYSTAYRATIAYVLRYHQMTSATNMLQMCSVLQPLQCKDARDHIAALLGLFPAIQFRIDYEATPKENYTRFARYWASTEQHGSVDVLEYATVFPHQCEADTRVCDWPSWVPDWRGKPAPCETQGPFVDTSFRSTEIHSHSLLVHSTLTLRIYPLYYVDTNCDSWAALEATFLLAVVGHPVDPKPGDVVVSLGSKPHIKLFVVRPLQPKICPQESCYRLIASCNPQIPHYDKAAKALARSRPAGKQINII